jgi:hypothetical protein
VRSKVLVRNDHESGRLLRSEKITSQKKPVGLQIRSGSSCRVGFLVGQQRKYGTVHFGSLACRCCLADSNAAHTRDGRCRDKGAYCDARAPKTICSEPIDAMRDQYHP